MLHIKEEYSLEVVWMLQHQTLRIGGTESWERNTCGKISMLEWDVWNRCSVSDASTAAAEAVSGHVVESGSRHILHMGTLGTTASTCFPSVLLALSVVRRKVTLQSTSPAHHGWPSSLSPQLQDRIPHVQASSQFQVPHYGHGVPQGRDLRRRGRHVGVKGKHQCRRPLRSNPEMCCLVLIYSEGLWKELDLIWQITFVRHD